MPEPHNAAVPGFGDELSLLWCVMLNIIVFGVAYRFSLRRLTRDRGQAVLDAALFGYAIQYLAVGLPGLFGLLGPWSITAVAVLMSALLWLISVKAGAIVGLLATEETSPVVGVQSSHTHHLTKSCWIILCVALFTIVYVLLFAFAQASSPVMSNDALTYHFPAAVQWLQTGKIGLYQTWFFNPANTYSPLAGSTFIAWLLAPLGNDALARFVAMPALLFTGIGLFQLCRLVRVHSEVAVIIAAAAILSRPMFSQSMMAKDDLFVTAFFLCALVALSPDRARERGDTIRLGVAIGLLLATKYTVFLSLPILLLAIDGPFKAGWRWRQWFIAGAVALVLAGPWYLRNFWLTGNFVFPVDVSLFGLSVFSGGLLIPARSEGLRSVSGVMHVLAAGTYGMPLLLAIILAMGWLAALVYWAPRFMRNPIARACLIGPVLGMALFIWRSPFPEVRFVLPSLLLLFAALAMAMDACIRFVWIRNIVAILVLAVALGTAFIFTALPLVGRFALIAVVITGTCAFVAWAVRNWSRPRRLVWIGTPIVLIAGAWVYVRWSAYLKEYRNARFGDGSMWSLVYPDDEPTWEFINSQIPDNAVLAYTNTYLTYPLQGFSLHRRLVYAPTRPGVRSLKDLPPRTKPLSGEQVVRAFATATIADADQPVWLSNLKLTGATYLLIARGGVVGIPPEAGFAASDPAHFHKLLDNHGAIVYSIEWHKDRK